VGCAGASQRVRRFSTAEHDLVPALAEALTESAAQAPRTDDPDLHTPRLFHPAEGRNTVRILS
jgi:hypothetical protein